MKIIKRENNNEFNTKMNEIHDYDLKFKRLNLI